jgi:hypothetical protein
MTSTKRMLTLQIVRGPDGRYLTKKAERVSLAFTQKNVLEMLKASAFNWVAMISAGPHELAHSMIHLYGMKRAFSLADRYARDCSLNTDPHGHSKWSLAAAVIGSLIDAERRLASLRS